MIASRRSLLQTGGILLAGLALTRAAMASEAAEIEMRGNANGSDVWFEPIGLRIRPGDSVRWTNRDPANSHTTTAFHPANSEQPLRIPADAEPWNSDYLLPDQSFSFLFTVPGVYDYFCIPHLMAGMAGRIVVIADGEAAPSAAYPALDADLEATLPSVEAILREGRISREA